MHAFRTVLEQPGSLAARLALAAEYRAAGEETRAVLIERQIAVRAAENAGEYAGPLVTSQRKEADTIIREHGRTLAGRVVELVDTYEFKRGVVARVALTGERFVHVAGELFALAPIQHVELRAPLGALPDLLARPEIAKLSSLLFDRLGERFGDAEAIALARAPNVANLRYVSLYGCGVGQAGVEELAASPYLANALFVELTGNPADATPTRQQWDTGGYGTPMEWSFGRPALAEQLERKFGARPWLAVPSCELPSMDDLATTP